MTDAATPEPSSVGLSGWPKPVEDRTVEEARYDLRADTLQAFVLPTAVYLLLALGIGGSSLGLPYTDLARLCAIPLLAMAAWRLINLPRSKAIVWPCLLLFGAAGLALLQLVPTPPEFWASLSGRRTVVEGYRAAGLALPWAPISLAPQATREAAAGLLPPAALFLAMLTLNGRSRALLAAVVLGMAFCSVVLGMLQFAGGDQSALRLYNLTDTTAAVGFFANRNHQGAFLAAALPLAALVSVSVAVVGRRAPPFVRTVLSFAIAVILIVGIAAAKSRAGLLLTVPALAGGLAVALRGGSEALRGRWGWLPAAALAAAGGLSAILVAAFSFTPLAARFEVDLARDLRSQLTPATVEAGHSFAPVGSGLGSFPLIYPMFETPETLSNAFINHAHNDYAEIWLECGWPGVILVAAFVLWWAGSSWRIMTTKAGHCSGLALAGAVIVGLLLVHSGVDYPLRTPALATLLAFACGLMTAPPGSRAEIP